MEESAPGKVEREKREMKIFVILLSYNSARYAKKCLDSVLNSSVPVEVVVVENASQDDSRTILDSYAGRIHLLPQERNLGFAGGNNLGITYAMEHGAEALFLLNMDTFLERDTIEKLMKVSQESGEKLLLSPLPRTFSGLLDLGFAKNACTNLSGHEFRSFVTDLYDGRPLKPFYRMEFICASALFLPVAAVKECGAFCPLFYPAYYEDNELFNRMTFCHWGLALVPEAVYFHDVEDRKGTSFPDSHLMTMRAFSGCLDPRNSFHRTFFAIVSSEAAKLLACAVLLRKKGFLTHFRTFFAVAKAYFPLKKFRKSMRENPGFSSGKP